MRTDESSVAEEGRAALSLYGAQRLLGSTSPILNTAVHADESSVVEEGHAAPSLYDANGDIDATVFHADLAKQAVAVQTLQQESTLQKLRQHFQRVRQFDTRS